MAVASTSMVRLTLPRSLLRRSCAMACTTTTSSTMSTSSSGSRPPPSHRLPSSSSASSSHSFSTTARAHRPPQPTQPVRSPAAEPAVVKAPSEPPNPVSWPGMQKSHERDGSSDKSPLAAFEQPDRSQQTQQQSPSSVPHAESSKSAIAREQQQQQQQHQQSQQSQAQKSESPSSTSSDQAACATLSPSSPAAPRSQGKEKSREDATVSGPGHDASVAGSTSAPKAAAPEATPKPSSATKFSTPNKAGKAFRAKKEALTLTPTAVERLKALLESDSGPRLIRIGVRNKGCAGMSYHLEYVTPEQAGKFDERVRQDGVEVLIDSKALFSIIGSEMDWKEDTLSAKFVFNNPNVKESCGCGESFLT